MLFFLVGAKEEIKASKQNTTQFNKSLHANTLSMPNQNLKLAAEKKNPNSMSKDKVLPQLEKLVPKSDGSRKPKVIFITFSMHGKNIKRSLNYYFLHKSNECTVKPLKSKRIGAEASSDLPKSKLNDRG